MKFYYVRNHTTGRPVSLYFTTKEAAFNALPDWCKTHPFRDYLNSYKQFMKDVIDFYGSHGIYYEIVEGEVVDSSSSSEDFVFCPGCQGESNFDLDLNCGVCGCAGIVPSSKE